MEEGNWKKMRGMHCIHSHFLGKISAKPFQKPHPFLKMENFPMQRSHSARGRRAVLYNL